MPTEIPAQSLQLRSLVKPEGVLELSLISVPTPKPQPDEVLVRVDAAPINPSDLGLLLGGADIANAKAASGKDGPTVTAPIPAGAMSMQRARVGHSLPVGNEGAGVVVAAGDSQAARALVGETVAILGGAMYSQYRAVKASQCLLLPRGTSAADGAACFVNPLTALGMVECMRLEGHRALVHTAAASNLGQMLQKLCTKEAIDLVNIVRRPEHVELLRGLGAKYVCDSSAASFLQDLTEALAASSATLAFDAIGGGNLANQILTAMEIAATRKLETFSRYGSTVHKQLYIYGGLDRSPTILNRGYGMSWGLGGWLITPFLQKLGGDAAQRLRQRVVDELKTTFASSYTRHVSLAEALQLEAIHVYGKQATGSKYLVKPNG